METVGTGNSVALLYRQLEQRFGELIGNPNTVACSSGTAALHLALESLRLPRSAIVLVPEFTMISCARAVSLSGLFPVFVDCGDDLLMRIDKLKDSVVFARAVMAVHVYGRRCDMDAIHEIAKERGLFVIEDMAELHGPKPHPDTHAACWSFYKNKVIHGEEGGMVAFRDSDRASVARQLRCVGFTGRHDFFHLPRGHNYRMANLLAAPILESLSRLGESLAKRRQVESWYDEVVPSVWRMPPREVCWVYDIRIPGMSSQQQDHVVFGLNSLGVAARHGFKPMSSQVEYRVEGYEELNAWKLSKEVIYLPVSPDMSRDDVKLNVDGLTKVCHEAGVI